MGKRMVMQLSLGTADATIVLDGQDYSPDVLNDVLHRAQEGLWEVINMANQAASLGDAVDESWDTSEMTPDELEALLKEIVEDE